MATSRAVVPPIPEGFAPIQRPPAGMPAVPEGFQLIDPAGSLPVELPPTAAPAPAQAPQAPQPADGASPGAESPRTLPETAGGVFGEEMKNAMMEQLVMPAVGFVEGSEDIGDGLKQVGARVLQAVGLMSDEEFASITKEVLGKRSARDAAESVPGFTSGRIVGQGATLAPVPGSVAGGFTRRAAVSAVEGAVAGGAMVAATDEERAKQAAQGAAGGAATTTAIGLLAKGVNAFIGRFSSEGADEIFRLSREEDIPVTAGDAGGALSAKVENRLNEVPVIGTLAFREGQRKSAEEAAARAVREAREKLDGSDDWPLLIQQGLGNKLNKAREMAQRMSDAVAALSGPAKVKTTRMQAVAEELFLEEAAKKPAHQNAALLKMLDKYGIDPEMNFDQIRRFRSDLADDISDFFTGGDQVVGKKGVHRLQRIKEALEEDIEAFGEGAGGKVTKAWRKFNQFYKDEVVPLKAASNQRAIKSETPDEIYRQFVQQGKKNRAEVFFNRLDEKGRDAVRLGMVEEAMEAATFGDKPFSPARFAGALEKIRKARGVFFKGKSAQKLSGLVKLMRHVERSGQSAAGEFTGKQATSVLAGGGLAAGLIQAPATTTAVASAALAIRFMLTTPKGARFLLAANSLQSGSTSMQRLLDAADRTLSRASAVQATGIQRDQ